MDAGWIAAVAVVTIDVGLVFLYSAISKRQIRKTINQVWNEPIELKDVDGQIIKIPVRHEVNGQIETKMIIGPLWMTVAYGLGSFSVNQIKMSLLGQKGRLSQKLDGELMAKVQAGELPAEMLSEVLPKKWQKYIAAYQLVRQYLDARGGQGQSQGNPVSHSGAMQVQRSNNGGWKV